MDLIGCGDSSAIDAGKDSYLAERERTVFHENVPATIIQPCACDDGERLDFVINFFSDDVRRFGNSHRVGGYPSNSECELCLEQGVNTRTPLKIQQRCFFFSVYNVGNSVSPDKWTAGFGKTA